MTESQRNGDNSIQLTNFSCGNLSINNERDPCNGLDQRMVSAPRNIGTKASEDGMADGVSGNCNRLEHGEPNETNSFILSHSNDEDDVQIQEVCDRRVQKLERG